MKQPLVTIIIVNYNGNDVLGDCLNSLKKINYQNYEVIIVDNGSTDDSIKSIKNSKYKLIKNKKNLGFAPANNQAAKIARGKYILLLNNDTKVSPEFLTLMVEKMESDSSIGAMQPKIFLMDNPSYLDNAGSFLNTLGFSNHWGFGQKDSSEFNKTRRIFAAKGACLLTTKEVIEKVGLFDDEFGSYFEESDFCWRVWLAGWEVIYFPQSHIYHKVGFTSSKQSAIDINYHSLKNRLASFIKNFGVLNLIIFGAIHSIALMGLMVVYLIKLQFRKVRMILKAFWWNIIHLSDTLKKRNKVQAIRTKTDAEILPVIMQNTDIRHMINHFLKVEKNFK